MIFKRRSEFMKRMVLALPFCKKSTPRDYLYDMFLQNKDESIHKWHHYFQIYERHFAKYRGRKVNILEIGVDQGGSMRMWKKYFGKNATVFGLDIDPSALKHRDDKNGIHVYIGDQSCPTFMRELMQRLPKIDILIDDGGHTTKQQINTFKECYDKIADDGVYLCEDLHTNYWREWI
ncbi:MAG: class I SAM-dependent methyltransferase, partial [Alphaproteobacteria bacterium]|nr:class I SAM-dependent methyltransferase [Alphaproteobacteria bacterium]